MQNQPEIAFGLIFLCPYRKGGGLNGVVAFVGQKGVVGVPCRGGVGA